LDNKVIDSRYKYYVRSLSSASSSGRFRICILSLGQVTHLQTKKAEQWYVRHSWFIVCFRLHISTYLHVIFRPFDKI